MDRHGFRPNPLIPFKAISDLKTNDSTPAERLQFIKAQMPRDGLFAGHSWRIAAEPFSLTPNQFKELENLGRVLVRFYQSLDLLYRRSMEGKEPDWVAHYLNLGKPERVVALQRAHAFKQDIPRVIRPDLLLTADGFKLTELDSIPGGIGLTAWLNQIYSRLGFDVVGGENGMIEGFQSIFGTRSPVQIMVSEEAATYRPEMEWVSAQMPPHTSCVVDTKQFEFKEGSAVYRFFEMFDLDQIPCADRLFDAAQGGFIQLTPPPKPILEEKLALALFHNRNLEEWWFKELGGGFTKKLQEYIPLTWVMDPSPIPPHAALPRLEISHWNQLKNFSQKQRQLIIKASGFAPDAWGARSVVLGSDVSKEAWAEAIDSALKRFPVSPCILQEYHHPQVEEMRYFDETTSTEKIMKGRTRLCPYYFVTGNNEQMRAQLGGVLATVCPEDKKIIHGMSEAILAPCSVKGPHKI